MNFRDFWKQNNFQKAKDDIEWITVRGAHIPIKPGQSRGDAVKEHLAGRSDGGGKGDGKKPEKKHGQKKVTDSSQFERGKLSKEHKKIEDKAFKKVIEHEDEILAENKKKNGKVVNTDDFRPHFKDEGYNGRNAAAVQEPSSYLAKRAYTEGLKNKGDFVLATSGGSGAGKSSSIENTPRVKKLHEEAAVVLDSNLSSLESAKKKVREAHEAGKKFQGVYIYREPMDALENGIIKRMKHNKEEMGRIVPNYVSAANHIDSWEVAKKLHKEGVDGIKTPFSFIDNSLGAKKAKDVSIKKLEKKIKFSSEADLLKAFNSKTKELYDNGTISKEEYDEYVAEAK